MSIGFRHTWLVIVGTVVIGAMFVAAGLTANSFWPRERDDTALSQGTPEPVESPVEPSTPSAVEKPAQTPATPQSEPAPNTPAEPVVAADTDHPRFDPLRAGRLGTRPTPEPTPEPAPPVTASLQMKRRRDFTEEDLRRQLEATPEIGILPAVPALLRTYATNYQAEAVVSKKVSLEPWNLMKVCPDVATLPVRSGSACRLTPVASANLQVLSQKLRIYLNAAAPRDADGKRPVPVKLREAMKLEMRGKSPEWLRPGAIPTMTQMLMHEDPPVRMMLVDILTEIPGKEASIALAQRAVFDLSPEMRDAAVRALKDRSKGDVRDVFLRGLRYPWSPAADHAAEALVALDDKDAVPKLVSLLKQPDPAAPIKVGKDHYLQEVVRANHLNNCMLCHPPAFQGGEPCLGLDPVVTIPATPALSSATSSIARTPGAHGYGQSTSPTLVPLMIRGDVTYLRQDFSVQQPVLLAGGPQNQRYDYLLRTRAVNVLDAKHAKGDDAENYPQREAVLFALRELTGKDGGQTTDGWRQLFPRAELDVEAEKLTRQLVQAPSDMREWVLYNLRTGKGVVYTVALANAIPSLKGADKENAREALIDRMTTMTANTLRDKFKDEDPEVRQAAILASVRKDDKQLVPELIALLSDEEPLIGRTALVGLKLLSGKDYETPDVWQEWWEKQQP